MQLVFFNVKTQAQNVVEVDDTLITDMDDIRILKEGDVYRPISTVPDEVAKLNKLRKQFEDTEFDELRKQFDYKKKEDVPDTFEKDFAEAVGKLIDEKYPEFSGAIKNRESTFITLSKHFLTYVFTMNRYDEFLDENKKKMKDSSYALDYIKRFSEMFNRNNWLGKKTISGLAVEIHETRKFMDLDDRLHAMYDEILRGASLLMKLLTEVSSDTIKKVGNLTISKENYGDMFIELDKTMSTISRYYDELLEQTNKQARMMLGVDDDKKIAYLKVLKPIVDNYVDAVDKFLRDVTSQDKVDTSAMKGELTKSIEDYFTNLSIVFAAYSIDGRKVDEEFDTTMRALWETSVSIKYEHRDSWYIDLGRVLYSSYLILFTPLLSEKEIERYKIEYAKNGITTP